MVDRLARRGRLPENEDRMWPALTSSDTNRQAGQASPTSRTGKETEEKHVMAEAGASRRHKRCAIHVSG